MLDTPDVLMSGLVAITSLGAYLWGRRRLGLPAAALPRAAARALETLGLALVFLGLNLGGAVLAIGLARSAGGFVSLYAVDDPTWIPLSVLQALVFQAWRAAR
jgi:hypothetical protein